MRARNSHTDIILFLICLGLGLLLTVQHIALLHLSPSEIRNDMPPWSREAAQSTFRYITSMVGPGQATSPMEALDKSLSMRKKASPFRIASNAEIKLPDFVKNWLESVKSWFQKKETSEGSKQLIPQLTLSLGGIFSDPAGKSSALINDDILSEGQQIHGYTLERILDDRIELSKKDERYRLTMAEGLKKIEGDS